ncbi:uncharacterized protein [Rhodnius prolixus]|uniref:uncharacterized protein n=1 Tax=Rhodnius prolixus TaxID=13249 RepID=UPI003D18C2AB
MSTSDHIDEVHTSNCQCDICMPNSQMKDPAILEALEPPVKRMKTSPKRKISLKPIWTLIRTYIRLQLLTHLQMPQLLKTISLKVLKTYPTLQTLWNQMLEIYSSSTNLDSTDAQSYFSDEPDDSSFMMSGSLDELNLLTQCVTTSLQQYLGSSDQMDSGTALNITPTPHTSTSSMTVHTPTKAVVADRSLQFNTNIKEGANNTITDESSDEEPSNVYPITSGIYNIIQRWKGANGSQRRSMATPGSSLVQIRIMPYQQAKTMDPTQRYKCTKKYAQVVLNPLQHTPQIRLLRQLFREMEKVTDTGSGLESNMPLRRFSGGYKAM